MFSVFGRVSPSSQCEREWKKKNSIAIDFSAKNFAQQQDELRVKDPPKVPFQDPFHSHSKETFRKRS